MAKCHDCKVEVMVNNDWVECPKCGTEWSSDDICSGCGDWSDSGNCYQCKMD